MRRGLKNHSNLNVMLWFVLGRRSPPNTCQANPEPTQRHTRGPRQSTTLAGLARNHLQVPLPSPDPRCQCFWRKLREVLIVEHQVVICSCRESFVTVGGRHPIHSKRYEARHWQQTFLAGGARNPWRFPCFGSGNLSNAFPPTTYSSAAPKSRCYAAHIV